MPYKSAKQRRYLHENEPEVARRWDKKYGKKPKGKLANEMVDSRRGKRASKNKGQRISPSTGGQSVSGRGGSQAPQVPPKETQGSVVENAGQKGPVNLGPPDRSADAAHGKDTSLEKQVKTGARNTQDTKQLAPPFAKKGIAARLKTERKGKKRGRRSRRKAAYR